MSEKPSKATPVAAAEAVEVPAVVGATFAERAKARRSAESKAVERDDDVAENKSVDRGERKSRRSRKS